MRCGSCGYEIGRIEVVDALLATARDEIYTLEQEILRLRTMYTGACEHPTWSESVPSHCLSCGYTEPL